VCPTKAIECTETKDSRSIWGRKFKLLKCVSCERAFATEEEYKYALEKTGGHETPEASSEIFCDVCRRKKSADVFAAAFGERV
jgi:hypothetical protein